MKKCPKLDVYWTGPWVLEWVWLNLVCMCLIFAFINCTYDFVRFFSCSHIGHSFMMFKMCLGERWACFEVEQNIAELGSTAEGTSSRQTCISQDRFWQLNMLLKLYPLALLEVFRPPKVLLKVYCLTFFNFSFVYLLWYF